MSVHIEGMRDAQSKDLNILATPKKRKHNSDSKDSSKKKKKQRLELGETPPPASQASSTKEATKGKKKRKDTDDQIAADQSADADGVELTKAIPVDNEHSLEDVTMAQPEESEAPAAEAQVEEVLADLLETTDPSSFHSTRLSLYVSIPAISLDSATSSILATHLAPLLLTYFAPAEGIVLGFSDPVLTARPDSSINLPLLSPHSADIHPDAEVLARTADEFGVCWVWLTATLLVFRPEKGDELLGWTNVSSEGFIGLVSYNYFQTAVAQNRIPSDWKWQGPTKGRLGGKGRKIQRGRLRDEEEVENGHGNDVLDREIPQATSQTQSNNDVGRFTDASGSPAPTTLKFRVVDTEIVPAHDRHKWSLQIDGTLLDKEAEEQVLEEERSKFERAQHQRSRSQTPGSQILMSGARGLSREGSAVSRGSIAGQTRLRL